MRYDMLATAAVALALATPAMAQKAIYTGGVNGAYHSLFCPPIPDVLKKADFGGYTCTPSDGTLDNIKKVLANPQSLGFVQTDVFLREVAQSPELGEKLVVMRSL